MTTNSVYGMELALGIAAVVIWIVLVFFRGGFWRVSGAPPTSVSSTPLQQKPALRVAVVIPARNEADVIGRAITSLFQQSAAARIHIFLVDDDSTDRTADRAREIARALGQLDRLTVLSAGPLPSEWSGKLWAVSAGVERAISYPLKPTPGLNGPPDYLLLTDADIVHAPESVGTLISTAESGDCDLVSFMVKLHCTSVAERLLIPAFVYFFFKLYPPRWIANSRRRVAGAAGGCMLLRPEALKRAGGIEAIRSEIIDDCALAKRIKGSGGRVWLGLAPVSPLKPGSGSNGPLVGTPLAESIRPYESFTAIENMIARTAFNQLRHSAILLLGCILGLALTYLAPVALLFSGHLVPSILGATAYALMALSYAPTVRFYGLNPLWALSLPAAALFYMKATVRSALNYWTNRGGHWKGRAQDPK